VQARREAFAIFQDGKAGDHLGDAIGRAWAAGLLDGTSQDPAILRDMGRRYATLHAVVWKATGTAVGEYEPRSHGTGAGNDNDHTGERYAVLDRLARDAGSKQRLAMRKLCVEGSPDEDPRWAWRLIEDAKRRAGAPFMVHVAPSDRDRMILTQAVQALVAMVEGK
jgi:hypothetical protein